MVSTTKDSAVFDFYDRRAQSTTTQLHRPQHAAFMTVLRSYQTFVAVSEKWDFTSFVETKFVLLNILLP